MLAQHRNEKKCLDLQLKLNVWRGFRLKSWDRRSGGMTEDVSADMDGKGVVMSLGGTIANGMLYS